MEIVQIVNDYRGLLKSVSEKVARIDHPEFPDMGLERKARGMVQIYQRIEDLSPQDVWQQATRSRTRLQTRITVMRQVDQLLGPAVALAVLPDWPSILGQLTGLVGGLPGDDPTDF